MADHRARLGDAVAALGGLGVALGSVLLATMGSTARWVGAFTLSVGWFVTLVVVRSRLDRQRRMARRVEMRLGDAEAAGQARNVRLAALEDVSGDALRRWSPSSISVAPPGRGFVILLVGTEDHLVEMRALAQELREGGVEARLATGAPHWDRVAAGLRSDDKISVLDDPVRAVEGAGALVTMKDWADFGRYVQAANVLGVPTLAKVEGVVDFEADPSRYRVARSVLRLGQFDDTALSDRPGSVVGSTRLERMWRAPVRSRNGSRVVINLNFAHGVLSEERDGWLGSAIGACRDAGHPFVVSVHPAERNRPKDVPSTPLPIGALLDHATWVVSRFSNVVVEAVVRGIPVVYHNPHGEAFGAFGEPGQAFVTTTDRAELVKALSAPAPGPVETRRMAAVWIGRLVDVDAQLSSEHRSAAAVVTAISS